MSIKPITTFAYTPEQGFCIYTNSNLVYCGKTKREMLDLLTVLYWAIILNEAALINNVEIDSPLTKAKMLELIGKALQV